MKLLAYILLISYLIYVIFGDSIYTKLLFQEPIKFPPILSEIVKRSVFLSYISLLLIAFFLLNKSKFTWNLAYTFSLFSLIGYIIKHYGKKLTLPPNGNYYLSGIIMHILYMIPLFMYPEYFDFSINLNVVLIIFLYLILAKELKIYEY